MRRTTTIASVLIVLTTTAACTPGTPGTPPAAPGVPSSGPAAEATSSGRPVFDVAGLDAMITKITADNNKANAALDTKALTGFESEAGLAMDQASLRVNPTHMPIKPYTFTAIGSHVPGDGSGADWFVVEAKTSFGQLLYPLVMVRDGKTWKMAHYVGLNAALPAIGKDVSGNAEVVDPADPGGTLVAPPTAVAAAHARVISDKPATEPLLAGDITTPDILKAEDLKEEMKFLEGSVPVSADAVTYTSTVAPYPVRALRTADGGAVVAYSTVTDVVATNPGRKVFIHPRFRPLGTNTGTGEQTMRRLSVWWALVPVKGSILPVSVLGGTSTVIGVG